MTLQTARLRTMEQVRAFVEGSEPVDYKPLDRASSYAFVRGALARFDYHLLGRADRGLVRAYIRKVCGFSPAQITRLIRQQAETGAVEDRRGRNSGWPFETAYGPVDIRLLAEVDEAFEGMSGLATCEILRAVHGAAARSAAVHVPVRRAGLPRRQRVAQRRAGSEYVNHVVAGLLEKLHVGEFTKSRPRRSNDNALVEGKNAHMVRRHLGRDTSRSASPTTWTASSASACRRSSTFTAPAGKFHLRTARLLGEYERLRHINLYIERQRLILY